MEQYKIVLVILKSYMQQWHILCCSNNSLGTYILTSLQHSSNPWHLKRQSKLVFLLWINTFRTYTRKAQYPPDCCIWRWWNVY